MIKIPEENRPCDLSVPDLLDTIYHELTMIGSDLCSGGIHSSIGGLLELMIWLSGDRCISRCDNLPSPDELERIYRHRAETSVRNSLEFKVEVIGHGG